MVATAEHGLMITDIPLNMVTEVWNRIPQQLHNDHTIDASRGLHNEILASYASILNIHRDVMADVTQTKAANSWRSYQHCSKIRASLLERHERLTAKIQERRAAILEAVSRVPNPPSDKVAEFVFRKFETMKPDERQRVMQEAIANNETGTLGAVLVMGPAYVWGLSEPERELYRDSFRRKTYPEALAKLEAIDTALELVNEATRTFVKQVDGLYDVNQLREAERSINLARKALGQQ